MLQEKQTSLFELGRLLITPAAQSTLDNQDVIKALERHLSGDWGDCCSEDWEANKQALTEDERLFSVYHDRNTVKFWIITEADRTATTILLPEDY
jgi:hypothetical protein